MAFSGQSTPAIVSVVALSTAFARLTEVTPQLATGRIIAPDILVDRLVAHAPFHELESADVLDDLLG
jgi:hypothetical protein